jgi:hypothetical protein
MKLNFDDNDDNNSNNNNNNNIKRKQIVIKNPQMNEIILDTDWLDNNNSN